MAIVTGASAGIGESIARHLAANGATVIVNGRDRQRLESVTNDIIKNGGQATLHIGDVRLEATHKELVELAVNTYGALHIAVNNAGVYQLGKLEDVTGKQVDDMVDINVKGVIYATKHQLPIIGKYSSASDWGSIINVSSSGTKRTTAMAQGGFVYAISKAAVDHATYLGAAAGAPYHVRVNAIAPGPVFTLGVHTQMGVADVAAADQFAQQVSIVQRSATGLEMAETVLFLVGKSGAYINGVVLPVDGGMLVK